MVLLFATIAGFAKQFLLPDSAASLSIWMPLAMAVHPWLAVLLFSTLTEFGSVYPRLDRAYRRLSLSLTILFLSVSLTGHYYDIAALVVGSLLLIVLINLAGAWAMSLRRNRAAWLYGLAFGPYLLGAVFRLAFLFGWTNYRFLGENAMQLAAIFHIILLNFPLAERLGRIKKERDQALLAALEATEHSQRKLEAQVEARTRELKEEQARTSAALDHERMIVQEQRQFLSLVSHEFRTPLAVMDGAAQMARLSVDPVPPELTRSTQSIQQGVSNLLHLLDTWLTTDRIASGLRARKAEAIPLAGFLTGLMERAQVASRRDIRIDFTNLPDTLEGDADLLEAALQNLIDNALKYSPAESSILLRTSVQNAWLHLEVVDQGQGIAADQLEQVTRRYFRGRNVGQIPGMGLGLHLVHTIAELHCGTFELESVEGRGTTARLVLPVGEAPST
jgi:signal transduction histidine kinase